VSLDRNKRKDLVAGVKPLRVRNPAVAPEKTRLLSGIRHPRPPDPLSGFRAEKSRLHPIGRKLRKKFDVEKTLDLHGLTREEAFDALVGFFERCCSENVRRVVVITGGSAIRQSTLRSLFLKWIAESFGNYVVSCSEAAMRHGGGGAFYLILKKRPPMLPPEKSR
jgi:DNA-nicking Smr family endonuclease